jgi:DNA-directed RNA polymerase subunit RPC12/RpoP
MKTYKCHYACFDCKKSFKRRLMRDIGKDEKQSVPAKCPQCGHLMANMGKDFEAPKMIDSKAWEHLKSLYSVGITFHSCGCSGPGYIPNSAEQLKKYLESVQLDFQAQLKFWRSRQEPENDREIEREKSKFGDYLYQIPLELRRKNKIISTQDAVTYWMGKIVEIAQQIKTVRVRP